MISGNPPHHSQTPSHSQNNDEPVTIDLEANATDHEEVRPAEGESNSAGSPYPDSATEEANRPAEPQEEPEQKAETSAYTAEKPSAPAGHSTSTLVASGIVGGLIALICAGAIQYAGLLPAPSASGGSTQLSSLNSEIDQLKQSVAKLSAAPPAKTDPGLEKRIAALEAAAAQPGGNAAATDAASGQKIADLTSEIDQLKANVTQATEAQASTGADITKRLDDAEKKLNAPGKDLAVAQAIAAAGLKAAIDRGGPFRPELDTFAGVAPDDSAVSALRNFAETGVPSRSELIKQVPDVVNTIIAATNKPDESQGWSDRLMSSAKSLVSVRPIGDVPGDSVEAIAARFENKIRNGDLPGAVAEWNGLPEAGKSASAAFKQSIEARIRVEDLVGDTLSKAIAGAGKQG